VQASLNIRKIWKSFSRWFDKPLAVPFVLLALAITCYGLLINRMGYFWDDFPLAYIKDIFGTSGLERYFSTNRPFWGILHQATFNLFSQPWHWQVYVLLCRWVSAVLIWLVIREIWPAQKNIAIWVSLLFLVYPGFKQQHISAIYGNLFFVLDCFLFSLLLNLKSARNSAIGRPARIVWLWHSIALLLSLYNLLAMEYFLTLELLRPLFIWLAIGPSIDNRAQQLKITLFNWLPYLLLWVAVTIWRVFFFSFQTQNYEMSLFKSLKDSPIKALLNLAIEVITSLWVVIVNAWTHIFKPPSLSQLGPRTTLVMLLVMVLVSAFTIWFLLYNRDRSQSHSNAKPILLTGFIACLLGGIPWWLIELAPGLKFPSDRFTLPFILGVSLVIVGLIRIIPLPFWTRVAFLGIIVGFAAGNHFQGASQFSRDWETQRRFFWQLVWRMPGISTGTTLMVNELPVVYYSDNSLTAPVNWFWSSGNTTTEMAYLLLYPSQRLGTSLPSMKPDVPIYIDYLAAEFHGTTSQVISIYYQPPACLRVLDHTLDNDNRILPMHMQAAASLSSTEWIQPASASGDLNLPDNLYAPEPVHGWCYYFEQADLSRQSGDWDEVVRLGDLAYQLGDYPNDPLEHFVYIEGYAHDGNWLRAIELSNLSLSVTPFMEPLLCRLWLRIDASTVENTEKETAIEAVQAQLSCTP
jgi:hypothetical protein